MEHVYGHCYTSLRLREPSGTFVDPQMDPEINPARLILEDPCQIKALQGPCDVHIDLFFLHRPLDNVKLKFTTWFQINPTFSSRKDGLFDSLWAKFPRSRVLRVKNNY